MDDLKSKGIKAFIWDFSGKMITHGMGFIISIFLARLLEPSDFGLIAIVMVIIGIASIFTDVGLGSALIQRKKLHPVHYSSVFYFNIFVGLLLTLLTYFSASLVSDFYHNEKLKPLIEVMSALFVINAFSSVQSTRLHKELNYALLTKIGLISSFISGIVGVSLAFKGLGVWSLVIQTLLMSIIYNILIWRMTHWIPNNKFSWKALTQLWGFGFRMFLSSMMALIFERLDFLVIGKLFPFITLGYFQRAKSLNNMVIQYSSGSLITVLFPILSKVKNDLPRFQKIIFKSLGCIVFVVFFILGNLYLISEELIILLFSEKWLPSVAFFKILILSGFAYPISALMVNVLSSRGKSKDFLRLEVYKKFLVSLNFIVLYFWGIEIYLYGTLLTSLFSLWLNIYFASREIELFSFKIIKPIISQTIITIISVIMVNYVVLDVEYHDVILFFFKVLLFTITYFIICYLFKTASFLVFSKEIMFLIKKYLST